MQIQISMRRAIFGGLSSPLKSIGSLCCGVCSKRNRSVPNKITVGRLQPIAMFSTGRCHITLFPVKNPPPAMHPYARIRWPLVFIVFIAINVCSAVLFAVLGFGSIVPVTHCVVIDNILAVLSVPTWLPLMVALYLVGGFTYAVRFPECLLPGTFDVWVLIVYFSVLANNF